MVCCYCVIFAILGLVLTRASPLSLAVMSLERNVTICFPLRHTLLVNSINTGCAIAMLWILKTVIELLVFTTIDPTSPKQYMQDFFPQCFCTEGV